MQSIVCENLTSMQVAKINFFPRSLNIHNYSYQFFLAKKNFIVLFIRIDRVGVGWGPWIDGTTNAKEVATTLHMDRMQALWRVEEPDFITLSSFLLYQRFKDLYHMLFFMFLFECVEWVGKDIVFICCGFGNIKERRKRKGNVELMC